MPTNNQTSFKLFFCFSLIFLTSGFSLNVFAQISDDRRQNWYCDERLKLNLYVGTILKITPYNKKTDEPLMANFVQDVDKYKSVSVIKFQLVNLYTGEPEGEPETFYNVRKPDTKAFDFAAGQKYLFEINQFRTELPTKSSEKDAFIKPDGFIKTFDAAKPDIDFLKSVKDLSVNREILKTDDEDIPAAENISVQALSLIKPFYSKELKKSKVSNTVKVFVVVDETGRVIKAKAFCAKTQILAESAEKAALLSRFAPIVKDGKPIKVKGIIEYHFKPF